MNNNEVKFSCSEDSMINSDVSLLEKRAGRQLGSEKYFGNHYSKTGIREHMDNGCYLQACCYG